MNPKGESKMRTLLIPLDRCIAGSFGRSFEGHCAVGWFIFAAMGSHRESGSSIYALTHDAYSKVLKLTGVFDAHDDGDYESVVRLFAEHNIKARYVPSATDQEILDAWNGRGEDAIDREFADLMREELVSA